MVKNRKCQIQTTLINLYPNYTLIQLQLKYIDILEVVILLMTYRIKYLFSNKTDDLNTIVFSMITGTNESKTLTKRISC